jgi:hypothetical protein
VGSGQSVTVNTAFATVLTATVRDQYGNPVPGISVTFNVPANAASASVTGTVTATTNASGQVSTTVSANTFAGAYTVTASTVGVTPAASFSLTNTADAAFSIAATAGGGQSATVHNAFGNLTATVRDQFGNPVPGVTVTFGAPASGASAAFTTATATTDASGQVTTGVTANTSAGSYTITAATPAVAPSANFSLTNTPDAPATISTTLGGGQIATVNTAFATTLTATVQDQYGNPVPDVTVTFGVPRSGPGATITGPVSTTTNASGQASTTVSANTVAGGYIVTASTAGITPPASFSLTNNPGIAASITATAGGGQSTTVHTTFTGDLLVTVRDAYGNVVPGASISFSTPGNGAGGVLGGGLTATTDSNGQVSKSITANTSAGNYTVTASTPGVIATVGFSLTNTPDVAASITATAGSGQSATVHTAFTSSLLATVRDQYGNAVPRASVTFSDPITGASVSFPGAVTTTVAITDASGQVSTPVTANNTAGTYTASASTTGVTTMASFGLSNNPDAVYRITATAGGGQSTTVHTAFAGSLVATVTDQYGNPVPGVSVTFSAPASGASATITGVVTATTSSSGQVSTTVSANTMAGSYTVTATTAGVTQSASFALANSPDVAATISSTVGSPQTTTVHTAFASALTVTVRDQYGNAVPGVSVTFTAPTTGASVTYPGAMSGTTNASGQFSITVSANTIAGSYTVWAAAAGAATPTSFALTNTPDVPASLTATSGNGQTTTVFSAFSSSLTATVRDQYGNAVSGVSVTFTAPTSGASGTFSGGVTTTVATTDASGQVSTPVTANDTAGIFAVTASAAGISTPTSFGLTSTPSAAFSITATAGGGQSTTVNTAFGTALTATVRDQYGNAVPGVSVSFSVPASGAGATLSGASTATTDANGQVSTTVSANSIAGSYAVSAGTTGVVTPASFALVNTPTGNVTITATIGAGQSATVNTAFVSNLIATVKDQYGNPVSGVTVAFSAPASGAIASILGSLAGTTDVNGQVIRAVTANTVAGSYTITASVTGVIPFATFGLTNSPDVADHLVFSQKPSPTPAGVVINPAIQVQVVDRFGNRVTTDASTITLALQNNPANGTLLFGSGSLSVPAVKGEATFGTLSIDKAGTGYTLQAADGLLQGKVSDPFTITPAPATHLAFSQQPTSTTAGATLSPTITVQLLDAFGNLATTDTSNVTLAIATANGATLAGTTTVAAVGGIATFTDLSIARAGIGYTLQASDGSLTSQSSTPFDIRIGAPDHLAFIQQPVSAVAGPAKRLLMRVGVVDSSNNVVDVSGSTVTVGLGNNPASPIPGILHGKVTAKVLHGIALFNTLWIDKASAGYTLSASVASATDPLAGMAGSSSPFTITAGNPFKVKVTDGNAQASTVVNAFAAPLTVTVVDAYGNPVGAGVTVTFRAPSKGASVSFPNGTTAITDSNGQASIAVNANTVAGQLQVTASVRVNNHTSVGHFTLTNLGDVATRLTVSSPPVVTEGVAFNLSVVARDQWGNVATFCSDMVQVSASDSGAQLPHSIQLVNGKAVVSVTLHNARTKPSQSVTVTDSSLLNPSFTFTLMVQVQSAGTSARQN